MYMKKLSVFLVLLVIALSCKKNKDKNSCPTDMTSLAGVYKVTAYTYQTSASAPPQDYYNQVFPDSCERDDLITLNQNGNYIYTDAGMVCSPAGDAQGTWSVSGTTITIDLTPSTIASFDCKNLVLTNSNVITTGDKENITFTRQ